MHEGELLCRPLGSNLPKFRLDILFLQRRNTDVFNVFFVLQKRGFQNLVQRKTGPLQIESERRDLNTQGSMGSKLIQSRMSRPVMNK